MCGEGILVFGNLMGCLVSGLWNNNGKLLIIDVYHVSISDELLHCRSEDTFRVRICITI